jgi:hypothetical protein
MIAKTGDQVTAIVRRTVETPASLVQKLRVAMEVPGAKSTGAKKKGPKKKDAAD